jgi:hypothetical protein
VLIAAISFLSSNAGHQPSRPQDESMLSTQFLKKFFTAMYLEDEIEWLDDVSRRSARLIDPVHS